MATRRGGIKRYIVICSSRFYPQYGTRSVPVTAPTKQWIKDNWFAIAGTNEYVIRSIRQVA